MITFRELAFRNLEAYRNRTISLVFFSFLMALSIFGGTLIVQGVRQGLKTVQTRLGADILVVPEDAKKKDFDAQTVLLQASPGYFYMPAEKYDEIRSLEGIAKASPQLFLASATASCCSAKLQLIGFDPETDFTVQPWIQDTVRDSELGLLDIFVGSNITVDEDYSIRLYGNDCSVKGQFAPTGSSLDNAVYMNYASVKQLIQSSIEKGFNQYEIEDTDSVISSVLIQVQEGEDVEAIARKIQDSVQGVSVATSKSMVSGIAKGLDGVSKTAGIFIAIFWLLSFSMTLLIFLLMIHERKREFASLKTLGADRRLLSGLVLREAMLVNLLGGSTAILAGSLIIASFREVLSQGLGVGFILPPFPIILLLALAAILAVCISSLISSFIAIKKIDRMDAASILKDGE